MIKIKIMDGPDGVITVERASQCLEPLAIRLGISLSEQEYVAAYLSEDEATKIANALLFATHASDDVPPPNALI
jgi:hypothetical protein